MANSTFSSRSERVPGKRGRPKKQVPSAAAQDGDGAKNKDAGGAKSVASAKSGGGGNGTVAPGEASDLDEDDDDDEADEVEVTADEKQREMEEEKARKERERKFASVLPAGDRRDRYDRTVAFKLESKHVRRIVNQVMSQSSGEKVVNEIMWSSKLFAARMIEGARDVQRDWAEGFERVREQERVGRKEELGRLEERLKVVEREGGMGEQERVLLKRDIERLRKEVDLYVPNPHRAGLLPDHVREALRRYRANGEGYGAGMQGASHSLLGTTGSAAYRVGDGTTGRRLFR